MTIRRGDIVELGPHRLMCGDCTSHVDVSKLFAGKSADLVFCSPPYLLQRTYGNNPKREWNSLMRGFCRQIPSTSATQFFVNLGMVHRDYEWTAYWHDWTLWMSQKGWRRWGWYIWDKMDGALTHPSHGRLSSCHEFIFHFAREPVLLNKTTKCKGHVRTRTVPNSFFGRRSSDGRIKAEDCNRTCVTSSHRISDSVTRISSRGSGGLGHPAPFPAALPASYIGVFSSPGNVVYDPFSGSGSSLIAADGLCRPAYVMDINPDYCEMAIARYHKHRQKQTTLTRRPA